MKLRRLLILLTTVVALVAPATVLADTSVTQSYTADGSVLAGMIVGPNGKNAVEPLASNEVSKMLGVVVPANDVPLALVPQSVKTQQVLVATSGRHDLLVSNENGTVKAGDYLTISAIAGIVMRAGTDHDPVIGQAAENFDGSQNVIGTLHAAATTGGSRAVTIGKIAATVRLQANPEVKKGTNVPAVLTRAAAGLTNKPVNAVRIYSAVIVLVATLVIVGSIFYSGVRSGITQLGRNPLARMAIDRGLVHTAAVGLLLLGVGLLAIYLILNI